MSRVWLALLVAIVAVVAAPGRSDAELVPLPPCANPIALPRPGARDVPTNARIWWLGGGRAGVTRHLSVTGGTAMQLLEGTASGRDGWTMTSVVPKLAPDHSYLLEYDGEATTFTTGNAEDHEAPAAPEGETVIVALIPGKGPEHLVGELDLYFSFHDDTALVRLDLAQQARPTTTIYLPISYTRVAEPPISLVEGPVTVTLTAIDLAGNESAPVTVHSEAQVDPHVHHDIRCELPPHRGRPKGLTRPIDSPPRLIIAFVIGVPLAIVLALVVLVALFRRYRHPSDADGGEPASWLLVEVAARSVQRVNLVLFVTLATAAATLYLVTDSWLSLLFVPWLVPTLFGLHVTAAMLRAARRGDATAMTVGSTILVRDGKRTLTLTLTIPELLAARERAVPTARMR